MRTDRPFGTQVDGVEIVAWRDQQRTLHVGPAACPHLGADLATGKVDCGGLICPWHGLRLDGGREFGWKPLRAYDDGVLVWVRLDAVGDDVGEGGGREQPLDAPVIPVRPAGAALAAVAGIMWAANYGTVQHTMGFLPGLKAFTAAVLGGIGNLAGAVVGGVLLGLIEAIGAGYLGDLTGGVLGSHYADIFAFIALILVLTLRPSGLLGERVADRA